MPLSLVGVRLSSVLIRALRTKCWSNLLAKTSRKLCNPVALYIIQYHKCWGHRTVSHCAESRWKGGSILMFRDASASISLGQLCNRNTLQIICNKYKANTRQIQNKYSANNSKTYIVLLWVFSFSCFLLRLSQEDLTMVLANCTLGDDSGDRNTQIQIQKYKNTKIQIHKYK